ncbi:mannosylglycerate hydrolase [Sebaldella sp. S0638]|uniref:mannosylglycerate hydrolase n=1 Tax=Sebaldella sp. S0638 TaxID=2957809 RepID=UPI00209FD3DA|nr:mannosylglycerate hydrolase [Sebaldella sp. S0638]MCP1224225.1 mannosylglycerate hydrolase [Sebaldella sp. S0638]
MQKTKVHIIPHSHWDKEWYFTSSRSKVYLVKHIKEVLDVLENKKDFGFFLMDAQSSLVEDYLKYCPEDEKRLKKLISEKRFLTGPWNTQTDQLVISQESVVRNLYYGIDSAEKMGYSMPVGYAPDIFGQGGNMPQIYKHFDIHKFLFWRGVADNRLKQTEFIWEGDDGTQMLAVQIPFGYYYGANIPENDGEIIHYLEEKIGALENKASTRHVYFPNGLDQAPVRKNLPELTAKFNKLDSKREYIIDSPENFLAEIEKDSKNLPVIHGELTEGKNSRIHKSIFSSRADLKQANNKIENFLVNILEPVLSISYSLGNRYPHEELSEIWKLMFANAAHDSIGACNSDSTNRDIASRYKLAQDMSENLLDLNMRLISQKTNHNSDFSFNIFNPLPYERKGVAEFTAYIPEDDFSICDLNGKELKYVIKEKTELTDYVLNQHIYLNPSKKAFIPEKVYKARILAELDSVPAMGYTQFFMDLTKKEKQKAEKEYHSNEIENKFYHITFEANNTLTIKDKKAGRIYHNQMVFEENGDDGDSYNYSPPRKDMIIRSDDLEYTKSENVKVYKSDVENVLKFQLNMMVPKDLENRSRGINSENFRLDIEISLRKDEDLVRFHVKADNQVLSHRLCVCFDTGIASKFSTADQLFGIVQRPVYLPEMEVWEKEKWQETPVSIEPMQSFTSLHDETHGTALITEGVREYEITGEKYDTIRLTLFRTFGYMGKTDLLYRPGRASGESIIETPDAQLLGELEFSFSAAFFEGSFDNASIARKAKEYLTPMPVYQFSEFLNGRLIYVYCDEERTLPQTYSLFSYEDTEAVMSAFKKAENDSGYIIRYFNPFVSKSIKIRNDISDKAVMLNEKQKTEAKSVLNCCEFQTYLLKL